MDRDKDKLPFDLADVAGLARPRYGNGNPEFVRNPFWEYMVRQRRNAWWARKSFAIPGATFGPGNRDNPDGPVWCFTRYGRTVSVLPFYTVYVGGEHEDYYDPDFCIYNDVFVHGRDGSVAVYGYPESAFPPTDFHTATLVGDSIYVMGSLGYQGTRCYGETPVYRLDVPTLRMERLRVRGEAPGWIYKHRAVAVRARGIRIWGGMIVTGSDSEKSHEQNLGSFVLDLDRLLWRREHTSGPRGENAEPAQPGQE